MTTVPYALTTAKVRPITWLINDVAIVIVLFVLTIALWLPRLSGPIDLRSDGSVYYILGTSLAEGKGYKLLNEPGEIEAIQYPPLLPLLVAAHQRVLGTSDFLVVGPWLRLFYFFVYIGLTLAIYWLVRRFLPRGYALLAALVCTLDLNTYYLSDLFYTEVPFALVTTLFVIFNQRTERVGYRILTALLGVGAYLLRTAGIALLMAWVSESLLHGRLRQAVMRAAVALLPILLWQAHIARVQDSPQYREPVYAYQRAPYQYSNVTYTENMLLIKPFSPELGRVTVDEMLQRIATDLMAVPSALGEALSAPIWFWESSLRAINGWIGSTVLPLSLVLIALVLLGCLVVLGAVLLALRREWFIPFYFAASIALLCLTPFPEQFPRYFMPLVPFLALSLFCALAFIDECCKKLYPGRWENIGSMFGVMLVIMIFLIESFSLALTYAHRRYPVYYYDAQGNQIVHSLFFNSPPWQELDTSLEWLRRRANPGDIVASSVPHGAYLRTGLTVVLPPMVVDREKAQRLLDSVPVKYLVLDNVGYPDISPRYAAPVIEKHPDLWKRIYTSLGGQSQVYERVD